MKEYDLADLVISCFMTLIVTMGITAAFCDIRKETTVQQLYQTQWIRTEAERNTVLMLEKEAADRKLIESVIADMQSKFAGIEKLKEKLK